MNHEGIVMMRQYGFPGPREELLFTDTKDVDFDRLYDGAELGATIIAFDACKPVDLNPQFELDKHAYGIPRDEWHDEHARLTQWLQRRGAYTIACLTHQSYNNDTIAYSGRAGITMGDDGWGLFEVQAIPGLRVANTDFEAKFRYHCPIWDKKHPELSRGLVVKGGKNDFPEELVWTMFKDVVRFPGNAILDFEVYKDTGELFYHDACILSLD